MNRKNKTVKRTVLYLTILFIPFLLIYCGKKNDGLTDTHNNKRLRDAMVSYMSEPMFRNRDFVQQITGTEADLKLYDMDEQTLYFSINKADFVSSTTLNKLTIDKNAVDFGSEQNGDVYLGAYTLKGTGRFLFRFPKNDFKPDSTRQVTVKLKNGTVYSITMNELADYADDRSIYGGKTDSEIKANKYMANHGAFVAKPGEESLKRLTGRIITDISNKEKTAQELLDFVTSAVEFSENEAYGGYEVLKRPNEVLMTGKSDCSGLTILYASLLEQAGINYRLVYFPGHIAVAVEGKFSNMNKLKISYEGIEYSLAETTVNGFVIGKTILMQKDITDEIKYIQKPGKDSQIIDFKTGKSFSN